MKRLSTGVLAAVIAASLGLTAIVASAADDSKLVAQAATSITPPADFGAPPSGEIPILFNDHHVYAKPDRLRAGRVLAALVRNGQLLVPLRSMFEQMGATVAFDPASKGVEVSKPGSSVRVWVGKAQVIINGDTRPLDVPPEVYQGAIVVPVRVISEGMGAYVQWVPDKRLVVVRYLPAPVPTPPPSPAPTAAPTTAPTSAPATPSPAPAAPAKKIDGFLVGDYLLWPQVFNELSPGKNTGSKSFRAAGALEVPIKNFGIMVEGDFRSFTYPHGQGIATPAIFSGPGSPCLIQNQPTDEGCVAEIGVGGSAFVPAFTAREDDVDARFGIKIADPRIYVGGGYMYRQTNYGYPNQTGIGFGIEKLPDLDQPYSIYGSAYYYPQVSGDVVDLAGNSGKLQYRILKYLVGATFTVPKTPVFLDIGYAADRGYVKQLAPSDFTHSSPFVGLGVHF